MKPALLLILFFIIQVADLSAQKKKSFKINPGEKVIDKIPVEEMYCYPEFIEGTVYFRNNAFSKARMNYNSLFAEMQYIDPKGDTLSLADEKTIRMIVINTDTFYFNEVYLQLIPAPGEVKLARHVYFSFNNRENMTGVGNSTSIGIETYKQFSSKNHLRDLVVQEIVTLLKNNELYIGDRFGNFKIANRKNLLEMYSAKEKEVQNFIKENKIDLKNEEDLKKLVAQFSAA